MAAISLIAGSVLGWIAAAVTLVAGSLASTAFMVFLFTSFAFAAITLFVAGHRART